MSDTDKLRIALRNLLDWGREHTSPNDANTPHELLVAARQALEETDPILREVDTSLYTVTITRAITCYEVATVSIHAADEHDAYRTIIASDELGEVEWKQTEGVDCLHHDVEVTGFNGCLSWREENVG